MAVFNKVEDVYMYPREMLTHMCAQTHTHGRVPSSATCDHEKWEQTKCPPKRRMVEYIVTIYYCAVIKRTRTIIST